MLVAALLIDLDGTLVDSTAAVEAAWQWVADELAVPFARVAPYIHGIPAAQAIDMAVPGLTGDRRDHLAQQLVVRVAAEDAPVVASPGAGELLRRLRPDRWAVVTSGDRPMARASLRKAGLPEPQVLVTSDDVAVGKPHPEPYLRAARDLGVPTADCLVIEDAPAGVASARAAGMRVVAVATTFAPAALAGADDVLADLTSLTVQECDDGLVVTVRDAKPPAAQRSPL